ncbi:MAG: hypothetical protein DKM50_01715 [Candidatus Margulisiibacteriota bacterium]|nr:MAG: hypothetical protein A2X43_13430 [Candidatus Margulisbacteria bacterium GWD2_39_127]OGI04741.1 MAG: hypothetical protein A2X42_10565 [Candidatus Margulisbacteria bacterium GWF2_38_17]OGI05686.1 MAG: hypothetical protein A2X41_03150 [Candidatus Margulisbacteria bacterium GWE2_39_32]PZM83620.1 MAG: hypothetical protein DKM50_01715 [Candidatus Margulisiibacteriota bacterium]HAR62038.1 hypothetical protein [Candidatus Margulisiibacteriota bacterium]
MINMKNNRVIKILFIVFFLLISVSFAEAKNSRIVSMSPNITEIMFFLGQQNHLVGVTASDDYPCAAKNIDKIGDFFNPSLEKIIAMQPTYIFSCSSSRHPVSLQLEKMGYPITDFRVDTLDDIFSMIKDISQRLGISSNNKIAVLKDRVNNVKKLPHTKTRKVLILFWDDPLQTVGKRSFINDIVKAAGGKNVFENVDKDYFQVNAEEIFSRKPDTVLIVMMDGKRKKIVNNQALQSYITKNHVVVINSLSTDLFLRAGPRVVDAVEQLSRRFETNGK